MEDTAKQRSGIGRFIREFKGEFKKIIWPSRKSLIRQTGTVLFITVIVGLIIAGYDFLIGAGVTFITNLF